MGKQVAARIKKKTMNRRHPREGTEGSSHKTDRRGHLHQQGSAVMIIKLGLPVIREFKRLRFLMTDKTVKKEECTLKTSYREIN